ncbi:MAG: type VI secretion protein IcmF/TssM N-terminal domain-containing protein, partial [Acidobacteriota bacterium]
MLPILTSVLILVFSIALAWVGHWLGLTGTSLLVFRIVAIALGLTAAVIILVLYFRDRRRDAAAGKLPGGSELNDLLREAERRIATAQRTGPKSLATLPLLYILGETNSCKTTTVLKSGLDPELIAGQVFRDQDVVATPVANFWYTRSAVLVEAGEAVRNTPPLWSRLIRRTRPKAIRSAVGQETPVRAAVVCLSSELFLGPTASDASLAAARSLNQMLRDLALQLGTEVPVYVILTKLDRIPSFAEFVRNLTNEEASEPFGMPFSRTELSSGLYAEKAMGQVTTVLDQIVFSLGEFRMQLLLRESDQRNVDPVYEFPRELRKLRNNLAACLVELVRPSHLNFNPYLRGLYFTGVRAQIIEQMVSVGAQVPQAQPADAGATRMFSLEQMRAAATPQAPQMVAQKVAQWSFLPRLLPSVILQDRSALIATSNSGRTHVLRRVTFALLSVLLLIFFSCLTVSWVNNNRLEQTILTTSQAIPAHTPQSGTLATEQDLAALDRLRAALLQLEDYRQN